MDSQYADEAVLKESLKRILKDRDTGELVTQLMTAKRSKDEIGFMMSLCARFLDSTSEHKPRLLDILLDYHEKRDRTGLLAFKKSIEMVRWDEEPTELVDLRRKVDRTFDTACDIQMIEKLSIPWTRAGFPKKSFYDDDPDEFKERKEMITEHPSLVSDFDQQFSSAMASVGSLDCLPSEVTQLVFSHLDFVSLAKLRQVSTLAKKLVDTFPVFKNSVVHSSSTLLAMREAGVLNVHPSGRYYQELTSNECTYCDDFGSLLCLYECNRICIDCRNRIPSRMANFEQAERYSGLASEDLKALTVVRTVNGTEHYMPTKHSYQKERYMKEDGDSRVLVVNLDEAMKIRKQELGIEGFKAWHTALWEEYDRQWDAFEAKKAARERRRPKRKGRPPIPPWSPDNPYRGSPDPYCWWVSTPLPYLDTRSATHQWGRMCLGCQAFDEWANPSTDVIRNISMQEWKLRMSCEKQSEWRRYTVYLRDDIVNHFGRCKWARRQWREHLEELYQVEENFFDDE